MNFMIEIRHIESGLAKVFHTVEEMAAHLAEHVKEEWEGWQHLRLHPALVALDAPKVEAEPAEATEPVVSSLKGDMDAVDAALANLPPLAAQPAAPVVAEPQAPVDAQEITAADVGTLDAATIARAHDPAQDTTGS